MVASVFASSFGPAHSVQDDFCFRDISNYFPVRRAGNFSRKSLKFGEIHGLYELISQFVPVKYPDRRDNRRRLVRRRLPRQPAIFPFVSSTYLCRTESTFPVLV